MISSTKLPAGNRAWLNLAKELEPLQSRLTPEQLKKLPFPRTKSSPSRLMKPSIEIRRECDVRRWHAIRGRGRWGSEQRDPVLYVISHLASYNLMVPTIWVDPPAYIKLEKGRAVIRNSRGEIIYDKYQVERERMMAGKPKSPPNGHGVKNPDWSDVELRPKLEKRFDKFPKDHGIPTDAEKEERVLAFLECYAETGHMIASGEAVGCSYYQLLIWANEQPHLIPQIALAEASVRMGIRSIAQYKALRGNDRMISLLMKEDADRKRDDRKAGTKSKSVMMEMSDEAQEVIEIVKRAQLEFAKNMGLPPGGEADDTDTGTPIETEDFSGEEG